MLPNNAEQKLKELAIILPPPPTPLGSYVEANQSGNILFLSGMLPIVAGKPKFIGRIGRELTVEDGRNAAAAATLNGLSTVKAHLGSLNSVTRILKLGVYIATEGDFKEHPKVADGASELLEKIFGTDKLPTRAVLGVASLPLGMSIEIELVLEIGTDDPR